jgi:hypothetical protein
MEFKTFSGLKGLQTMLLHAHIVGGVEIIDAHHAVAGLQQQVGHTGGDETGRAGEQISGH